MSVERRLRNPDKALKAVKSFRQLNVDAQKADDPRHTILPQISRSRPVIESIMLAIDPDTAIDELNRKGSEGFAAPIDQCDRLIGLIENAPLVRDIIGNPEPLLLCASGLEANVIKEVILQWKLGYYSEAICQVYLKLERKAQQKLGEEKTGTNLWEKCFAMKGGLKISGQIGTAETQKSERQGVQRLAQSVSLLVSNPIVHTPSDEKNLSEEEALEYLAMLSSLSRWLDRCP